MSIRKIAGRTSSLAVSATTTQFAIRKAAQVGKPLVARAAISGGLLINKATLNSLDRIRRLSFDPDGQGLRHIYDFLGITDATRLFVNKAVDDNLEVLSLADVAIAQFVLGRNPTDTLTAADVYKTLIRAYRKFPDSLAPVETKALATTKSVRDTQSFLDSIFIARVKNFYDTVTPNDTFKPLFTSFRRVEDSVGMLDNFYIGDGITYEEMKGLRDSVMIGAGLTGALRAAGDPLENITFFYDKYLDPDAVILDTISKLNLKGIADLPVVADINSLYNIKPFAEVLDPVTDTSNIWANKGLRETLNLILTNPILFLDKEFADISTMLDSMDFGDHLTYGTTKFLAEYLSATDVNRLLVAKPVVENATAADNSVRYINKAQLEVLTATESNIKFAGKRLTDAQLLADFFSLLRPYGFADNFIAADRKYFWLNKAVASDVTAQSNMISLFDNGIGVYNIKPVFDTEPIADYFARQVLFIRYPFDFFLDDEAPTDRIESKVVLKEARAGVLNVVPILRSNVIAYSEQFDYTPYWQNTGLNIIPNALKAPAAVVNSPSPTYDAAQLQELFYNKQLDPYGKNWFQLVPGRFVASSDADKIVQNTSNSIHKINTPNIPELNLRSNFSFSIFIQPAGTTKVRLYAVDQVYADFDLSNNSIITQNCQDAWINVLPDGWRIIGIRNRISTFGTAPQLQTLEQILYNSINSPFGTDQYNLVPANANQAAHIYLLDSSGNSSFTGDGVSGVYIWGAQIEFGEQIEQEHTALNYIRTAGGPASKLGYRVTPADRDRVYVGSLERTGFTTRQSGDAYENVSFINKKVTGQTDTTIPTDFFRRAWYAVERTSDVVNAGTGAQRRFSGNTEENVALWINKTTKKSLVASGSVTTYRTNYLKQSERFDYNYWNKNNISASTGISILAGALPYRNVLLDADSIYDIFYNKKYSYQGNRWYDMVPLRNKPNFTSNAIVDLYENNTNSDHSIQTFGLATNLNSDFFASSVYASNANGVNKFRMQVGTVFADFDLSSQTVISSLGVLYSKVTLIDAASNWYLCQIVGPTQAMGTANFLENLSAADRIYMLRLLPSTLESLLATDSRQVFWSNKFFNDPVTMLDNALLFNDGITYADNKAFYEYLNIGTLDATGLRSSGNTSETTTFTSLKIAQRAGTWTSLTIKINNTPIQAADQVNEFFYNSSNNASAGNYNNPFGRRWFQLAPYYASSVHLDDWATDYDRVRIGSQVGGRKTSNNAFETTPFLLLKAPVRDSISLVEANRLPRFHAKRIDETKQIARIPGADAAHVAELFFNRQTNIDGGKFTPQDGNYTYYRKNEWYNLVPRFSKPNWAWGTANTPGAIMLDYMMLGDGITFTEQYNLRDSFVMGTGEGYRTSANSSETLTVTALKIAKQGAKVDLYVGKNVVPKYSASQALEFFYGTSNNTSAYTYRNPYKRSWFKLAPYYGDYGHAFPGDTSNTDIVQAGGFLGPYRWQNWGYENIVIWTNKLFADTTNLVDNMQFLADGLLYSETKAFFETLVMGSPYTLRVSGDPVENVSFVDKMTMRRSGTYVNLAIKNTNPIKQSADQINEFFYNSSNNVTAGNYNNPYKRAWFQLAPYYASSTHLVDDPGDFDRVRIGSQTPGLRSSADPFEKLSFYYLPPVKTDTTSVPDKEINFVDKRVDETKQIPRIARADAAHVSELFWNTQTNIDGTKYTPQDGNYTYYRRNEWYSLVPRFNKPTFAWGTANTPGARMLDNFYIGDGTTFLEQFNLRDALQLGSPGLDGRLAGAPLETISFTGLKVAKQGAKVDLYVGKNYDTRFSAVQGLEFFYGSSNNTSAYAYKNPYKKSWFKLAKYYNEFGHVFPGDTSNTDIVQVGSFTGSGKVDGWGYENITLSTRKLFADSTAIYDNMQFIADGLLFSDNKTFYETTLIGLPQGLRVSGDTTENVSLVQQFTARRSGTFKDLAIKTINTPKQNADQLNELFYNTSNNVTASGNYANPYARRWFQLAPYYKASTHIVDNPSDYDSIRIGTQFAGIRVGADPYETLRLNTSKPASELLTSTDPLVPPKFYDKRVDETKSIPRIARADAAHVSELFWNTATSIDGRRYTPQDGNYIYYRSNEWYNLVPRYGRPQFAWGSANTPGTIMIDNMAIGDGITFQEAYNLRDSFLVGTQLGGTRYHGDTQETLDVNLRKVAKQGATTDLYVGRGPATKFAADQGLELFYGTSNNTSGYIYRNPYKRAWYKLAAYYADYGHSFAGNTSNTDLVRIGSFTGANRSDGWGYENIVLTPHKAFNYDGISLFNDTGFRSQTGQTSGETTKFSYNVTAHKATTSAATYYSYVRTNYLNYSENFAQDYWTKVQASVTTGISVMSAAYPYRNTIMDANQIFETFHTAAGGTSSYTYLNNYYKNNWYSLTAPRRTASITSNVLQVLRDSATPGVHYMQATAFTPSYTNNYFSYSLYVQNVNSVRYFRMSVDRSYVDFDLSSVSVVTSSGVQYASIKVADSSAGVYLCQFIDLTAPIKNTLLATTGDAATVTLDDIGFIHAHTAIRGFTDSFVQPDVLAQVKITDYQL